MSDKVSAIRIAVLLDDLQVQPWQRSIFDTIEAAPHLELTCLIHGPWARPRQDTRNSTIKVLINATEHLVSRQVFRKVFAAQRRTGDQPVAASRFTRPEQVYAAPEHENAATPWYETIDIALDLTTTAIVQNRADLAGCVVWFLSFGSRRSSIDGIELPGFHEVLAGKTSIPVDLLVREPGKKPKSIVQGRFRTFLWSWSENERQLRYKAALLMIDALQGLADHPFGLESQAMKRLDESGSWDSGTPDISVRDAASGLARCWWRIAAEVLSRIFREEKWRLYVARGTPTNCDLMSTDVIEPPAASYWADPFVTKRGDRTFVYFEEYFYASKKGVISCAELSYENDRWICGPSQVVIENAFHMSYPFLFEVGGNLYMIPESSADRCIGLWKCIQFPGEWQKISTLMDDVSATDTTLHFDGTRWWMFTNIDRTGLGDHCSELHIFHASDLFANSWIAHKSNPVVRDASTARMAGPIYKCERHGLVRPAQVNARYYGNAVSLRKIVQLDPDTYREEPIGRIDPDWRREIYRTHHISAFNDIVVLDGCRDHFKLQRLVRLRLNRDLPKPAEKFDTPRGP